MKEWIKQKYYWWQHLLWLTGRMIMLFFKGDMAGAYDASQWIRVHLTYKSKRIK